MTHYNSLMKLMAAKPQDVTANLLMADKDNIILSIGDYIVILYDGDCAAYEHDDEYVFCKDVDALLKETSLFA